MNRLITLWVVIIFLPVSAQAQTDEVIYVHTDAIGSMRMITDANGQVIERYDYLPFGEPWTATPTGNETRRFTGQERDFETGLDYFGARYYASGNGRFIRPDDPGFADFTDPQSLNLYSYVRNNPLRFVDPTGHVGECPAGSGAMFCSGVTEDYPDWTVIVFWLESLTRPLSIHTFTPSIPVMGPPNPTCVAAARNSGIAVGGMLGGYVGVTGGAVTGGLGGSVVAPGVGTVGGGYAGGTTGFLVGSAGGAVTGGFLGSAAGNILCASSASGSGGDGGGSTYKKPKPGLSGKEGAKDVPSWTKGQRPRVGESGKDFAKRLLDERYGPGKYDTGPGSEFNKIRKWGDRAFE